MFPCLEPFCSSQKLSAIVRGSSQLLSCLYRGTGAHFPNKCPLLHCRIAQKLVASTQFSMKDIARFCSCLRLVL